MKIALLSDNVDTLVGMRLVGVKGSIVHEEEEIRKALEEIEKDQEIGILLITDKLSSDFPHLFQHFHGMRGFPILVEIPDRHGREEGRNSLLKVIRESMGVKI